METQPPPDDAVAALDLVHHARTALADRLVTPWWYHPVLGLLLGAFLASYAVGSGLAIGIGVVLYGVGVGMLTRRYRQITGVWVNGLRAGSASRWAWALGAVALVAFLAGLGLDRGLGQRWGLPAAGLLVAVATVVLGRRFDEALRAQLRRR